MPTDEEIFAVAIRLPEGDRPAYLDGVCESADQRERVEAMVQGAGREQDLLTELEERVSTTSTGEGAGAIIDRYKLLQKLGEGGMGEVWMAEQREPVERRVALKIVKAGMDTREVVARFEAERQALALMDHPHIASVLDGGATQAGRPYFVMELVHGVPVTAYCDQARLETHARLDLFRQICEAVAHAHQKGVIHRDLKPSNIMVTNKDGRPVPKIIDFGVAKATSQRLTERTLFTRYGQMIGTPAYMSPEQAQFSAEDVDIRSDIYSLGVLLYELLTGSTPFDDQQLRHAAFDEICRVIRTVDPPKPSVKLSTLKEKRAAVAALQRTGSGRLERVVRGELDWIVMKALDKDRSRRYQTAGGFGDDIGRYLRDEAVEASPPSTVYRMRKFVRRHRAAVSVVAAIVTLLVGGITGTTWFALREREQRTLAEANETKARSKEREANESRAETQEALEHLQLRQAEQSINAGDAGLGAAYLSTVVRNNPMNAVAASRLMALLISRNFPRLTHIFQDVAGSSPDGEHFLTVDGEVVRIRDARTGREVGLPMRHNARVRNSEFSPDRRHIVTSADDNTLRVWDASTAQPVTDSVSIGENFHLLAFSPDGAKFLTVDQSSGAQLWVTASGERVGQPMRHDPFAMGYGFSADGSQVLTASQDALRRWDASTGLPLGEPIPLESDQAAFGGRSPDVTQMEFNSDGSRLAAGFQVVLALNNSTRNNLALIFDTRTGKLIGQPMHHPSKVQTVAFSHDGQQLVTSCLDNMARIWNATSGVPVGNPMRHGDGIVDARFSPDGKQILTSSLDRTSRIWDAQTGEPVSEPMRHGSKSAGARISPDGSLVWTPIPSGTLIWEVRGDGRSPSPMRHADRVSLAKFSPDGRRIATGSSDKTVRLWDSETGGPIGEPISLERYLEWIEFSPDGALLATSTGRSVQVWDARTGRALSAPVPHSGSVMKPLLSQDGSQLLTVHRDSREHKTTASIRETTTGRVLGESIELSDPEDNAQGRPPNPLCVAHAAPDGFRLLMAAGKAVRLWGSSNGKPRPEPIQLVHEAEIESARFSQDGDYLVVVSGKIAQVWDARTGLERGRPMLHDDPVRSALIVPNSTRVVTYATDNTARLWDPESGETLGNPMRHDDEVEDIKTDAHGKLILTVSNRVARTWDALQGNFLAEMRHEGQIFSARFDPGGARVLTASGDMTARVWNARTGQPLTDAMRHDQWVVFAEFNPNGNRVATASWDNTARVWHSPQPPLPVPGWVADWAEAATGRRLAGRRIEEVGHEEMLSIRERILASSETDLYTKVAKWYYADPEQRRASPWSEAASEGEADRSGGSTRILRAGDQL